MSDVYIQEVKLPMRVKALTIDMPDGTYTVLVNADLADEVKREARQHELDHIEGRHFELAQFDVNVDTIERIMHGE